MRDTTPTWQKILAQGFSTASELLNFLRLPLSLAARETELQFKTRVPRGFAALMEPGNPNDPLLLQVLAVDQELEHVEGFTRDPLCEVKVNPQEGLLHKYHGRVLLTLTGACAIHCRYCFRRHFPYQDNNPGRSGWDDVLTYIQKDESLHEVILSGGDPLLAKDAIWIALCHQLSKIPHVKTLRIHTRIPVVLPERVDASFIDFFSQLPLNKVVVIHSNHARELDHRVAQVCTELKSAGATLLNQSVLLRGVNDEVSVLKQLSETLFSYGVLPYYLHVLDKVQGAAHFDVPLERIHELYSELQALLPGYLVPRLAREEPGAKGKTLISLPPLEVAQL
jgi:EF-P beta-lysylation protein EpmB